MIYFLIFQQYPCQPILSFILEAHLLTISHSDFQSFHPTNTDQAMILTISFAVDWYSIQEIILIGRKLQKIFMMHTNKIGNSIDELIINAEKKENYLRSLAGINFQEQKLISLMATHRDLLSFFAWVFQQDTLPTSIFGKLIDKLKRIDNGVLALCHANRQLISSEQGFIFSHSHLTSQSVLLGLFLAKYFGEKVELFTSDKQLRGLGHALAEETEADRLGFLKEIASKQRINFNQIYSWQPEDWISAESVVVVDLFGLNPLDYRPFLLRHLPQLSKSKKLFLYHSNLQDEEVNAQLQGFSESESWIPIQLWSQHPSESLIVKDEEILLQKLIEFIQEDSKRPQRQDIAIFIPVDTPLKKYSIHLAEHLGKQHLRDQVNVLTRPLQSQLRNKNNIFLVSSAAQLAELDYDYSSLYYVLDYQTQTTFIFDQVKGTHIRQIRSSSGLEKAKRMAVLGSNRIGSYICIESQLVSNPHYADLVSDLSAYVLRMVVLGQGNKLETSHRRVAACLKLMEQMEIVRKEGQKWEIGDRRVLAAAEEGVNPISAKLVLDVSDDAAVKKQEKSKLMNLMAMVVGIMSSETSMQQEGVIFQALLKRQNVSFWKNAGYLQSCLTILTKCDSFLLKLAQFTSQHPDQAEVFKRLSSKVSQNEENNFFGSLFQLCEEPSLKRPEMDIPSYLKQHSVNEQAYEQIKNKLDQLREILSINPMDIILEKEDIEAVQGRLITRFPQAVVLYSGSKRLGYKFQQLKVTARLNPESFLGKSCKHPEYLFVLEMIRKSGEEQQIEQANEIHADLLLSQWGKLPIHESESHGEAEVEFHGISSVTFQELIKNYQSFITNIEEEHNCVVEMREQLAMVIIHCQKQGAEKLRELFEGQLEKIKQRMGAERKVVHYLGTTNLLVQAGGEVQEILREKYIDQCLLSNIHPEVTKQDLLDLFQQFCMVRELKLSEPEHGNPFKTALIHFYTQKDYLQFYECFHGCVFFDLSLQVKPLYAHDPNQVTPQQYIDFTWFVWQSCRKALIQFHSSASANKAMQDFKKNSLLDQVKVEVSCNGTEVMFENLAPQTDEVFLSKALSGYGEIMKLQLLKYPIREQTNPEHYIQKLIRKAFPQEQANMRFKMGKVKKGMNGARTCRVNFEEVDSLLRVVAEYDHKIGVLGEGRLYALSVFEKPVLVPSGLKALYFQILDQTIKDLNFQSISNKFVHENYMDYIILMDNSSKALDNIHRAFLDRLKPVEMKLNKIEKNLLFNDIAISNLLYVQDKYRCKLVFDMVNKVVSYIATKKVAKYIKDQIKDKISTSFFYFIRLTNRAYKHVKTHPDVIEQLKTTHKLTMASLQLDNYSLLINGSLENVESASIDMMHLVQSLQIREKQMNPDLCGICCDKFKKPYRLQGCSHLFCMECLQGYFRTVIGDMNLFPVKCPQCAQMINLKDLESSLNKAEWDKLKDMSINKYVGLHSETLRFCYTAGCKQLNFVQGAIWSCDTCKISYCNLCKEPSHIGFKCEDVMQIRQSDEYFRKYMNETGGRFCPKETCKMPVIRTDGCYRVTCTRCNISMCFKCPPDQMQPFQTSTQCYDHLTKEHGGYW